MFEFNAINLDVWTETYGVSYYMNYLANFPDLFSVVESASTSARASGIGAGEGGGLMGYVMGKMEGRGQEWHGHVSAITVSPSHRRLGLASMMMDLLESVSEREDSWFVDLFVRESNDLAIGLYESLGYIIYRRVVGYYGGGPKEPDEDGFDMRKPLPKDKDKVSTRLPAGHTDGRTVRVRPEDIYFG
ncbi:N-alpha-acetyltransferase 20 [Microbotryomycetes sp. JL221]|nr:N-alpha-acetyltransferase 20 [Microbotryomycetes sp. JL221]